MEKKLLLVIGAACLLFFLAWLLKKHTRLRRLVLSGAGLLSFLLIIEFAYRSFIKEKDATDTVLPNSIYTPDTALGYRHGQPLAYHVINRFPGGDTVYNTTYTIVKDTFHTGPEFNFRKGYKSANDSAEAIFLGCGLTFGQGLADTETLPYYFGAAKDLSTINMACSGYGLHQVYQLFTTKFGSANNHNRIFIYPFFYDHILHANGIYKWNSAGPFFDVQNDSPVNRGPLYKFKQLKNDNWSIYASLFGAFSAIKDPLHKMAYRAAGKNLMRDDYYRCFLMLSNVAKQINSTGGKLIIINWGPHNKRNIPVGEMATAALEQQLTALKAYGATVVPVTDIININDTQHFIPRDGHPSAKANLAIANWLAKNVATQD